MAAHNASLSLPRSRARRMPLLALAATELRIGLRNNAFRFTAALCFALGWSVGGAAGRGVSMSAYTAGETACQHLGVFAVIWMALSAIRDTALQTDVLVYSKPQPTERLALARFLGAFGQTLVFLAALFAGAVGSRWLAEGSLLGFPAYGVQFVRAAGALFFAAAASYALALLADSPVAGSLVGLYWVVAMSGREFMAKVFFPWYTQNLPGFLFLGLFLLGIALRFHRRRRRGASPVALWLRAAIPSTLALCLWSFWVILRDGHDPQVRLNLSLEQMTMQNMEMEARAPGFLLPDQNGRLTSLSDFPDRILLIALWSPQDADSTVLLARLQEIYRRYGARGLLPVAVCLSEDSGVAATFARGEALSFPVVHDWGTHNADRAAERSPISTAYRAEVLPRVAVTDRRRRVRALLDGLVSYNAAELERIVQERLQEEPK